MMTDWQEFTGGEFVERYREIRVTMNRNCEIGLSSLTNRRLGNPKAVKLYFDVGGSRIGVKPAEPGAKTFEVVRRTKSHSGTIRGRSFCRHYGIKPEATIVFQDVEIDADGIMVLDLRKAQRLRR